MTYRTGSNTEKHTHDVILTDPAGRSVGLIICNATGDHHAQGISRNPIERTAMKTYQGDTKWSDFQYPWTPIAKTDWSGGRGLSDGEKDTTRYSDGYRADTTNGYIIAGPQENYAVGLRTVTQAMPGKVQWIGLYNGTPTRTVARKFVFTPAIGEIWLLVRRVGSPAGNLFIKLDRGVAAPPIPMNPLPVNWTITKDDIPDVISEIVVLKLPTEVNEEDTYWLTFTIEGGDEYNHWEIGANPDTNASTWMAEGYVEETLTPAYFDVYCRVAATEIDYRDVKLFHYKRSLFAIYNKDGAAPRLCMNGDRGVADAPTGGASTLLDSSKAWTTDMWAGAVVVITAGKGSTESQPYRTIVSNTATQLNLDAAWKITHDTTTEYAIIKTPRWQEITGHGLTAPVTSIMQSKDMIYMAQGSDASIRKMRWRNNSGTATWEYDADGTNKADHLVLVRQTDGLKIWRSDNSTMTVTKSAVKDWGTALASDSTVTFDDHLYGRINNLVEYGDAVKKLYVMREGMGFTVDTAGTVDKMPLEELAAAMQPNNGKTAMVHNVYLYFSMGPFVERFYGNNLDDVGPTQDDGLPANRQGDVVAMVGLPGRYLIAVDAGPSGYSSVLLFNQAGLHEIYRAPKGKRITAMAYQTIYGGSNRLWIAQADDMIWLDFPSMTADRYNDPNSRYTHEAVVENGYVVAGMNDIYKLFYGLKIVADGLSDDQVTIKVDYRLDDADAWTTIDGEYNTSPVQTLNIDELGVSAKKITYRMRLQTKDNTKTARVRASVLDTVSRVEVKYAFGINYRLREQNNDLQGNSEMMTSKDKQALIDQWAATLTPLRMQSRYDEYSDCVVFIDPSPSRPTAEMSQDYIHELTLIQVTMEEPGG